MPSGITHKNSSSVSSEEMPFFFCHENKNDKPQHHRARDDKPIPPYFKPPDAECHGIYIHKNVV